MNKKTILNIESVYTANAFTVGSNTYIAAGSETKPSVQMHDMATGETSDVDGCPGGVMSFVPVPGAPDTFYSIMGLFPPFVGLEAGVFRHRITADGWNTERVMHLPFAHRCDILSVNGKNYLFAASASKHKENPLDWSQAGETYVMELDENGDPSAPELVFGNLTRNHGMLKYNLNGTETVLVSGAEGIFALDKTEDGWKERMVFDKEVSEFGFIDLDGDGADELVTIEPFHGNTINVYKKTDDGWNLKFTDSLSFGHGLSCGMLNGEPVFVVGNRRGSLTLDLFTVTDLEKGEIVRNVIEEETGPTQTLVFNFNGCDYILSANQLKNEVAIYWK